MAPKDSENCFNVSINVAKTGTNTFSVHGLVTFICSYMSGGGFEITNTLSCPGVGNLPYASYKSFPSGIYTAGASWSYLNNFTGYCEHCTNHIPDAFPFFTVTTYTFASTFIPEAGTPVSNPASYTIPVDGTSNIVNTGFSNSPAYRIPC